jgi:hypothetical protein
MDMRSRDADEERQGFHRAGETESEATRTPTQDRYLSKSYRGPPCDYQMDEWQKVRVQRSKEDIHCIHLEFTDDSAVFSVMGTQGYLYEVEIDEDRDLWPPRCTCEDNTYRRDYICKHICFILRTMGVAEEALGDLLWIPSQEEIHEFMMYAPEVICDSHYDK